MMDRLTMERNKEYKSEKYKKWRTSVFKRDKYTCQSQSCGRRGKHANLQAHHLKEWAKYPELRYNISNGLTLCKKCHDLIRGINQYKDKSSIGRMIKMNKIRIGIDLDGTLTRLPYPFEWFLKHRKGGHLTPIDFLILRCIEKLPLSLDGRLIASIPSGWEVYIITARVGSKNEKAKEQLMKYSFWKEAIFRPSFDVSEADYKVRTAKWKKVDYFFDDRLSTLEALRKAGIEAIDIKEIRKWLKKQK